MSDHKTPCVTGCGADPAGYFLCHGCTQQLVADLRAVPGLCAQLNTVITRQTRHSNGVGVTSKSAERPLPVNLAAADVARDLHNVIGTWARDVADRTGRPLMVVDETPAVAAWLLGSTATLRTHPAADELHDEVTDAISRAWRIIDRPAQAAFAGPCDDCGADLYGRANAATLQCRECGAEYRTDQRREWLLEQARDRLVTAAEAARALPALLGHTITPAMIRGYAHRGRIAARPNASGKPHYRVGDIIDCVMSTPDTPQRSACA